MDVFNAFPQAVVSGVWELGQLINSTETGRSFASLGAKDVIVDEVVSGSINTSPRAAEIETDTLLYAKVNQMPTANAAAFISDYLWLDGVSNQYYTIIEVGLGKNQQTGEIEHIEFRIRPTEVVDD